MRKSRDGKRNCFFFLDTFVVVGNLLFSQTNLVILTFERELTHVESQCGLTHVAIISLAIGYDIFFVGVHLFFVGITPTIFFLWSIM